MNMAASSFFSTPRYPRGTTRPLPLLLAAVLSLHSLSLHTLSLHSLSTHILSLKMLAPPGSTSARGNSNTSSSSTTTTTTPRSRSRKAEQQSPEAMLRNLQKLPPNKKCADCGTRLPQCVNLTTSTFVCMACSGVLRELNHKIKGIAHSSFTLEEVRALQQTNNELQNQIYLATFNARSSPLQPPTDNRDLERLRAWVRRKYRDKAWYREPAAGTVVTQLPPKPAHQAPPTAPDDLLGFRNETPTTNTAQQQWDAFSGATAAAGSGGQEGFANFSSSSQQQPAPANNNNNNNNKALPTLHNNNKLNNNNNLADLQTFRLKEDSHNSRRRPINKADLQTLRSSLHHHLHKDSSRSREDLQTFRRNNNNLRCNMVVVVEDLQTFQNNHRSRHKEEALQTFHSNNNHHHRLEE